MTAKKQSLTRYESDILEEELKNKVGNDFFGGFDHTEIKGKIDFAVRLKKTAQGNLFEEDYYLWAEAKAAPTDPLIMLTQLILTIGKAKTHEKIRPPHFLGCFDRDKIAFVPYFDVQEIFAMTDFNWKVTPSDHDTKEFKLVHSKIKAIISGEHTYTFKFDRDEKDLKEFIKKNFVPGKEDTAKIQITKNNFKWVYDRWVTEVKPSINVDWDAAKRSKIKDGAFYLADLLSENNKTLKEKLFVLLKTNHYELDRKIESGFLSSKTAEFKDGQKAHTQFWAKYERPPKEEYWNDIVERQDLLVPPDIRMYEGSFYTPPQWVELSQKYIADVFGEDWQDEYYIWDCAAGTGNLLAGLTNPRNIWASTLDKADVAVMKTLGVLFENHVFQFDFLNDNFTKLPKGLRDIIADKKRCKKLIIYINPPYAEDTTKTTITKTGQNKVGVAQNKIHDEYATLLKKANHELFAQFLIRIYKELQHCKIANFSTLKALCSSNFVDFRQNFQAKLKRLFVVPANTFDNVSGQFPIGFHIWDADKKELFKEITADVFDKDGEFIGTKNFSVDDNIISINKWITGFKDDENKVIGLMVSCSPDFQHNNQVAILSKEQARYCYSITKQNLIQFCIYFSVRHCIPPDWLNDRDQFLCPNNGWIKDLEFQSDCLAYTLFHSQNAISSKHGVNHWIPFTEKEINARESFDSHFMLSFISGKIIQNGYSNLFEQNADKWCIKRKFSPEATAVFKAGRELWKYYHGQSRSKPNAALYDIREHFQGRDSKGKMNSTSTDEKYNDLMGKLRDKLKILAQKIEPKVYEYGFLKE